MNTPTRQSGFTAIELLITLFVAAAFLIASYQLFNVVVKDGGQARSESRASNVAYDYMRRYSPSATDPCTESTPLTDASITVDGLSNAKITVKISCLPNMASSLSKIDTTVTYNNPPQTVKYSSYANGTGTPTLGVTDGLISWWKFNGDTNTAIGNVNGTNTNATPTVGQNGVDDNAFYFNGSNAKLNFPLTNFPPTMNTITASIWLKPTVSGTSVVFVAKPDDTANRFSFHLPHSNTIYWDLGNISTTGRVTGPHLPAWLNTWSLYTLTSSPTDGMKVYRNGSVILSSATNSTFTVGAKTLEVGYYAAGNTWWQGSMDDMRIYNRVLTPTEISTIYAAGAQ